MFLSPINVLISFGICSTPKALLTPFNNKPESSRNLTILIRSSISSFGILVLFVPDPKIFLYVPASPADTAAVNPKGIKTLLAYGLIIFFISLPRNPTDCIILDI